MTIILEITNPVISEGSCQPTKLRWGVASSQATCKRCWWWSTLPCSMLKCWIYRRPTCLALWDSENFGIWICCRTYRCVNTDRKEFHCYTRIALQVGEEVESSVPSTMSRKRFPQRSWWLALQREIQDNASSVLYRSMEEVESLQDSSTLYTQHQHFTWSAIPAWLPGCSIATGRSDDPLILVYTLQSSDVVTYIDTYVRSQLKTSIPEHEKYSWHWSI